jgi:deazaflavin-dependent oxidoreductase (nitroreductase family)
MSDTPAPARNDWNSRIIDEFKANDGKVGGPYEGQPMILVHHRGRKSGVERVNPMIYQPVDGGYAVFASKAGAPVHPDWYRNLVANPTTTVEVGTQTVAVVARELTGEERHLIWERQKRDSPNFADYETKAAPRTIPVLVFEPIA